MRSYKDTSGFETPDKIYVVTSHDTYDSWDVSYHKTKKGAYKWIMATKYQEWLAYRYLSDYHNSYDYYVSEKHLGD